MFAPCLRARATKFPTPSYWKKIKYERRHLGWMKKMNVLNFKVTHFVRDNDRKCTLCNRKEIGDEFHYTLIYPVFQQQRQIYLESQYLIDPDRDKFSELIQSQNLSTLRKLAKFITEINYYFN